MTTPTEMEMCETTGRLITEWFEYPEKDDKKLLAEALKIYEITEEEYNTWRTELPPNVAQKVVLAQHYVGKQKRKKWKNNMSQQEVAMRMNEATKMIDPSNYKFLPDDVRERTGLEINPLWQIECLVRSGLLTPKEQVAALKELASYTHSKSPSINHSTVTHAKPEDWLLELAKEEYREIEVQQPMQPAERGSGKNFEKRQQQKVKEIALTTNFAHQVYEEMDAEDVEFEEFTWNPEEDD